MKRFIIEQLIRLSMAGLRYAVAWRMKKLGYTKDADTWSIQRQTILPTDPQVSVSVHEGNAIKDLVNAAVTTHYRK